MPDLPTLATLSSRLHTGQTTSLALVNACPERIQDPAGEGALAFLHVDTDAVRHAARASDELRQAGVELSPLMGIPVSVKDLFDVAGQPTPAGSTLLADTTPAATDAECIARLRRAGAIIIGRTNMTEFAYSGLGLNPHYGTPAAPYDRSTRRIPGGSSSGAGVSVADQMAVIGMGTDTGGSVRIPAALCGITGFKPTAHRLPTSGVFPLSSTFDSVGPLGPSVACCKTVYEILAGVPSASGMPSVNGLRLAIPTGMAVDGLDEFVGRAFESALSKLSAAGARISEVRFETIENPDRPGNGGTLLAAEAYAWHRPFLEKQAEAYDRRVSTRMMPAAETSAADYINLVNWRKNFVKQTTRDLSPYDALILPTTPIIAPPIAELEASDEAYFAANTMMLRNTSIINQLDGCALSMPCHKPGAAPVGLMLAGGAMEDDKILNIGLAVEAVLDA